MSKYPCKLIEDLLPLYIEDDVSDETKAIIEDHLKECENCRKLVEEYSNDDIPIEDFKEDLPKAKTYKKSMKKLKKWSIISAISLILVAIAIGVIGYKFGEKPKNDVISLKTIVKTLEKEGVELEEDKSKSFDEYQLGGITPETFSVDGDKGTLLVYNFKTISQRDEAVNESENYNKLNKLPEVSFKAKNAYLVYVLEEYSVYDDEWSDIGEIVDLISDTVFQKFNDGKVMVFKGESESWEGTFTLKYYEHWWHDEDGTLKLDSYQDGFPEIKYKISDIDSVGPVAVEYEIGSGGGSMTGATVDSDGKLDLFHTGGTGGIIREDDEITFTIKWNGKEEKITMKAQ
ncbi:zf-HC2 domain-containing protein [Clostridium sp. DL1XJH146]